AHYHGLVNDALFNDIGCNRDAGLGPLLQQVIVYVIAKVVTPLNLDQFALVPGQAFQLSIQLGYPAIQIDQGNGRRVNNIIDILGNGRLDVGDLQIDDLGERVSLAGAVVQSRPFLIQLGQLNKQAV